MFKQILTTYSILMWLIVSLDSCKKSDSYAQVPSWGVSAKMVFTPEDIGTTGTNQTDTSCSGTHDIIVKQDNNDSSTATLYFDMDGKIYTPANPPYPEGYAGVTYMIRITSPKFKTKSLQVGQMYWSSTTANTTTDVTSASVGYYYTSGDLHNNVWQTIRKDANINYAGFSDSYIKLNISKIYSQHEEDGDYTYVDGNFDVTLLGAGKGPFPAANYWDQLHLTGSFHDMQLKGY
ncbi:MAG: hypothetical protein JNL51_16195 [Chitinophagaceae bacterium]|nr:hypothetical protein [Chitinophagaceae bacterium]